MAEARLLILASSSPQRRQLLLQAGVPFQAVDPPIDEPDEPIANLPPARQAESLAYFKARSVADRHPGRTVLAADTIVAGPAGILGKPADADDARRMLAALSGTTHQVITGIALITPAGQRHIASDTTSVTMKPMSRGDIEAYIDSGEWMGKAGAYAIQLSADRYVDHLDGSFTNVVGLPMELVMQMLGEFELGRKGEQ